MLLCLRTGIGPQPVAERQHVQPTASADPRSAQSPESRPEHARMWPHYAGPRDARWDAEERRQVIRAFARDAEVSEAEAARQLEDELDRRGLAEWGQAEWWNE